MESSGEDSLCRSCAHPCDDLVSINDEFDDKISFSTSYLKLSAMLSECANIDIDFNDGLPSRLCVMCVAMLRAAYAFRRMCRESDMKLRKISIKDENDSEKMQQSAARQGYHEEEFFCEPLSLSNHSVSADVSHDKEIPLEASWDDDEYSNAAFQEETENDPEVKTEEKESYPAKLYNTKAILERARMIDGLYICEICGKSLSARQNLVHHVRRHLGIKLFSCSFCHKSFPRKYALARHRLTHAKKMLHPCEICVTEFESEAKKEEHIDRFHPTSKLICNICERIFGNREELRAHSLNHKFLHVCDQCPRQFMRKRQLDRHKTLHEAPGTTVVGFGEYECYICRKRFNIRASLKAHLKSQHRHVDDPLEEDKNKTSRLCPHCGKNFNNSSTWLIHVRRHNNDRPFKCRYCEKSFTNRTDLRTHERIHTGERPYECDICGKRFIKSNVVKRHRLTHTNERPYKCPHCDRGFNQTSSLKVHVRGHTGEKPHGCNVCGERFIQRSSLKQHLISRGHGDIDAPAPRGNELSA